jgi:hypothetical protein
LVRADISLKTSGKPALITQLCSAVNEPSIRTSRTLPQSTLLGIQDRASELQLLFVELEE